MKFIDLFKSFNGTNSLSLSLSPSNFLPIFSYML